MAVTIQQIAEKAGVSRGTVDRALNNRGRINPEVAEMVKRTWRGCKESTGDGTSGYTSPGTSYLE